jgi:hypothetical protein
MANTFYYLFFFARPYGWFKAPAVSRPSSTIATCDSGEALQSGHSSKQSLPSLSTANINAVPLQVWHTNISVISRYNTFVRLT